MRIGNNIVGLQLSNRLQQTSQAISRSLERLSTGKRVNRPSDDIASFSQSIGLDSKVRGLRQANLNINSAQSLLNVATSAISSQQEILQKMREIAVQASSGTLTSNDRSNLNAQLSSLLDEFSRISNETEFNGLNLLNPSSNVIDLLIGAESEDDFQIQLENLRSSSTFRKTQGVGTFTNTSSIALDSSASNTRIGDLNDDGHIDMVALSNTNDEFKIYLNDKEGGFTYFDSLETGVNNLADFQIEDINKDGILDIVGSEGLNDLYISYIGNGDGSFTEKTISETAATNVFYFSLSDMNNDGNLDAISFSTDGGEYTIAYGDGEGGFSEADVFTSNDVRDLITGDINGDGNEDVVIANYAGQTIYLYAGDGQGGFTESSVAFSEFPESLRLVDVDNDGDLDIWAGGTDGVDLFYEVFLNDGQGDFTSQGSEGTSINTQLDTIFEDIDSDGHLDLIGSSGSLLYYYSGDGQGNFSQSATQANDGTINRLLASDFDGDGIIDFAAFSALGDSFNIYTNKTRQVTALSDVRVDSTEQAQDLIDIVDGAQDKLLEALNTYSNLSSRLEVTANLNLLQLENFEQAKSLVEDADFAQETAELVKQQILQQAQIATLSQANLNMQVVLSLLNI